MRSQPDFRLESWQGFESEEYDRSKTHVTPNISVIVYTLSYDLYIYIVTGNQPCYCTSEEQDVLGNNKFLLLEFRYKKWL